MFQFRAMPGYRSARAYARGVTLIELMVVVTIVAILAAIALPNYSKYVQRSRRAAAHDTLLAVATAQERYYTNHNAYATDLAAQLGFNTTSLTSDGGYYVVSLSASTANSFTLLATAQGTQVKDACKNLTLTNTGLKGQTGDDSNGKCW